MYSYKLSYIIIKNHHLYCLVLNEQLITLFFHCVSYMSTCMFMCKSYSFKLFCVPLGFLSEHKDFISFFLKIAVRIHYIYVYLQTWAYAFEEATNGSSIAIDSPTGATEKNVALVGWCCSKQLCANRYRKYTSIDCDLPIERTCLWLK